MTTTNEYMTVLKAAKEMGFHFSTLYRWIESGKILTVNFGGIIFVPRSEVERMKAKKNQVAAEAT